MDDRRLASDAETESVLRDVGHHFAYPPTPQTVESVRSKILHYHRPRRPWVLTGARPPRALALAAVAVLLAITATAAVPSVRKAVAHFFHVPGVVVTRSPVAPSFPRAALDLGRRLTLAQAQRAVAFSITVPRLLGSPDAVFFDSRLPGGEVNLVYRSRPGLPEAPSTGAGMVITEFRGDVNPEYLHKDLGPNTTLEETLVNGAPAYWFAGPPHTLLLADPNGDPRLERVRLAANTLVWARGEVTYRIESLLTKDNAVALAASMP